MTQRPSGWYDDPKDPTQLRYWDGILWSDRTMPKLAPGLDHVGEARPVELRKDPLPRHRAGDEPRSYQAHWGPEEPERRHTYEGPAFRGVDPRRQPFNNTVGTLSTLPRRVAAAILDWLVVVMGVSLVMSPFLGDTATRLNNFEQQQLDALHDGRSAPPIPGDILGRLFLIMGLCTLALIIYDTLLSARGGKTLGRLVFNTRAVSAGRGKSAVIDLRSAPPFGFGRALLRSIIKWLPALLGLLGLVPAAAVLLAGLGSERRQGLHDRAAGTEVRRTN